MPAARRLSRAAVAAIGGAKYLRIRSGTEHRFIWIWAVVVNGRVFVRSWNDKPGGWFRSFLREPLGALDVDGRVIRITAVRRQGERLMRAIEDAYAEKYTTPANRKYVVGFRRPRRRAATMELVAR